MPAIDPSGDYRIIASAVVRRLILDLQERSTRAGFAEQFSTSFQKIERSLATDPIDYGDPVHEYRSLKLSVYHRVEGCIHVSYAVDKLRRLVYINVLHPFPAEAY